jgi:hypothetical protein
MAGQSIPQQVKKDISNNPLAAYFRQPKIYIKLPSGGNFYQDNALDASVNNEYAVYAMTAKDELMFKTPDALMNGQATVEVIKSCVPAIKQPWGMPSIDVDAVLIAIRIATYGEKMEVNSTCPSCSNVNDYHLNLVSYIENVAHFHYDDRIEIGPLSIYIKPYTYQEATKTALKSIEQQKIFQIVNDENMSDELKIEKFGESFVKLTELTVDVVANSVVKIDTPDGSVEDKAMILEFIQNSPKEVFSAINDHVNAMKDKIELRVNGVECSECSHKYDMPVTMDQTNFFVKGS